MTLARLFWVPNSHFPLSSCQDVCQQKEAALLGLLDGLQRQRGSHLQLQAGQPPQRGRGEERDLRERDAGGGQLCPGTCLCPQQPQRLPKSLQTGGEKRARCNLSGRSQQSVISHAYEAVVPGLEGWEPRSPPQLARLRASSKKAQPSRSCLSFSVQAS